MLKHLNIICLILITREKPICKKMQILIWHSGIAIQKLWSGSSGYFLIS